MSIRSNLNKMYVTVAMIFTLTSCSLTKNMVWVNSPKDLENRVKSEKVSESQIGHMQNGMTYFYKGTDKKTIPYQTLINSNRPYEPGHPYNLIKK